MEVEAAEPARQTRKRHHTKPVAHVEFLKNLAAEKAAAKKLLKDIRAKSKAESKRHRRLMNKASKLSMAELNDIAEMKSMQLMNPAVPPANTPSTTTGTPSPTTPLPTGPGVTRSPTSENVCADD
jgi:membrane protein involved in colicin uptake